MKYLPLPSKNGTYEIDGTRYDLKDVTGRTITGPRTKDIVEAESELAAAILLGYQPPEPEVEPEPVAPSPEPVPESISMHKFRGQLILEGHTPAVIEAMLGQIPNETARELALNEWRTAPTVQRAHPMVAQLAIPLGYDTPEKVDAFFIRANDYTFGS